MRKSTGIVLASGLVLALAACAAPAGPVLDGGSPVDAASCTPLWDRDGLAADVTTTGEVGTPPTAVDFPTPLVSRGATSSAVLSAGDGAVIPPDAIVSGIITIVDGQTGRPLAQWGPFVLPLESGPVPYFDGAACATVGSRVAAVGTVAALLGEDIAAQNNVDPETTVVTIVDITDAYLSRAQGSIPPPQNGLPTVSYAANGRPGLSFTNARPPADLRIETLIQGNGTTVQDGDTVLVNYTGVIWDTKKVFDSSWDKGVPAQFPTTGVVEGFSKALVGARVGSQVLAAVPPAQGYGDTPPNSTGITPTDTLVFVIDILGVLPPAPAQ